MQLIERFQPMIILAAVILGLFVGQFHLISVHADPFIVIFLMMMLYGLFLAVPLKHFGAAFKHIRFLSMSTAINFLWTPVLAWVLGAVFLADYPALWIGFILLLVTPCTDWYLIFTSIAKGNMTLSTSILPVNLILQVILLPVYLFIFSGTMGGISAGVIIESVILVLLIPLISAVLTRRILKRRKSLLADKLIPLLSNLQIVFLFLAVTAMFASHGALLVGNPGVILFILIPLCIFFLVNFFVAKSIGRLFKFNYEDLVSLNMTIIARNSPLALAVVVTVFPDEPLVALVLIIGPLIELPVLMLLSQVLIRIK